MAGSTGVTSDTGSKGRKNKRTDIMNERVGEERITEGLKSGTIIPINKGNGDAMESSQYRRMRLLEHGMKVYGGVLKKKPRKLDISNY